MVIWGKKLPCYYEKITYSKENIKWICFFSISIPLIYTAGYINSALKFSNFITWILILVFLFLLFHGDALLHLISSDAPNIPTIIEIVYVKPKSLLFYSLSCSIWIIFPIWKILINYTLINGAINTFLSNGPVENISINLISLGQNDSLGMLFLVTPILGSYILEKYFVGISNNKLRDYVCKPGTPTGRILYPLEILAITSVLFFILPVVYFYIATPLIGKIIPPIFSFNGFQNILRVLSISGRFVVYFFLIVVIVEWLIENRR